MDLSALLTYLKTLGDPATLAADDQALPAPLRDLLSSVPGQRIAVSPGATGLHLDGRVLTISGTCPGTWPIDGLGTATLTTEALDIRCTADDQVTGTVTGRLPLNQSVTAPVTVTSLPPVKTPRDVTARGWRIALPADVSGVTPIDLMQLRSASADSIAIIEPPGLDALGRQLTVPASAFGITFYPGTRYEAFLTFEVDLPEIGWAPVPGLLTLDRLGLAGTVSTSGWSIGVVGRFSIGTVPMRLVVGLADETVLTAGLEPVGAAAFPGLAALAMWATGGSAGGRADPGIDAIGGNAAAVDAAISSVRVRFDCATAKLREVFVGSLLTLGALKLDVGFSYPRGTVTGTLHNGEPLLLTDVLTSLGLPATGLAAATRITEASFSARPALGNCSADLTVDTALTAGPLTIKQIFIGIARADEDTGFTGQIGGEIALGSGLRIDLLAEYLGAEGGWLFSGCTTAGTKLDVGVLLADLAHAFGVADVPAPVRQLSLSDLAVDYQTGTGAFHFTCTGTFPVADVPVTATIGISVTPTKSPAPVGHETVFSGRVTIGDLQFDLVFDTVDHGAETFVASYTHTGDKQTVSLHDLVAEVSTTAAELVPSGLDIGLTDARLLYLKPTADAPAIFALGLVLSAAVDLAQLPLIGDKLPADETLAVDGLQIFYSSAVLTALQLEQIGRLLPKTATPLPPGPLGAGVSIAAQLQAGPTKQNSVLSLPPPEQVPAGQPPAKASPAGYWLDVHRQLGVVQINRLGLLYQNGALFVGLDAAITLGPLSLSLDGLAFGSPLTEFVPEFRLSGLGLSYSSGPLTISGALLRIPEDQLAKDIAFQFDGTVQISAASLELAGLGSYAQFTDGRPSLFVFAQLDTPLGGPPAFFVDGLMGGFGFNRTLALPGPDEVTAFPLLALGAPSAPGKPPAAQDPGHILDVLEGRASIPGGTPRHWIEPEPGAIWLALGVAFTSYELVRTRALLVADISEHFKLALLGSSTLRMPQTTDSPQTYAYVELGIEAVVAPDEGYFGLTAILSRNSFVLSPDCHLTGGFAIATWFGANPHAGDFVLTLGGYHPAFPVPGHFPVVPRLGFRWTVSDTVTISGSAYAALTTSCFMAGGRLEAVFQDGGLRAWFTVEADLLISWRPFFFSGHFALSIGVSYSFSILGVQKTIGLSVGASLDLWGPATGGTVTVSLWVISFTVAFGAPRSGAADAALGWPQFRELLPPKESTVVIQPAGELQATLPADALGAPEFGKVWVVRATGFAFSTQSAIPVSDLRYGAAGPVSPHARTAAGTPTPPQSPAPPQPPLSTHDHTSTPIDIKPMNLTGVASVHRLTVHYGSPTAPPLDVTGWTLSARTAPVPDSLWGKPPAKFSQIPARPDAKVLSGKYVGYDVQTPTPTLGANRGTVPASALADDYIARAGLPLRPGAPTGHYHPMPSAGSIPAIAGIAHSAAKRSLLFAQVKAATGFAGPDGALDRLAARAEQLYSDSPMREG